MIRVPSRKACKPGAEVYRACLGTQETAFGGYVLDGDCPTSTRVSQRIRDPHWRGKYTGGSHKSRAKAKEHQLTEEEIKAGQEQLDSKTQELVIWL